MKPNLTLISHHLCPYVQRAVIVLSEKNIPHERRYIELADKPDWFRNISPLGRVPILRADDAVLFESQVIAEYLDEITDGSLHPVDALEKARHRAWIEYGSETLGAIAGFYSAKDASSFQDKRRVLAASFQRIEAEITAPFFAGDNFHMIDGVWGTIFRYLDVFDQIGAFGLIGDQPKLMQWRHNIMMRPSVIDAVPTGYPDRLRLFLKGKNSYISGLISGDAQSVLTIK